jgi:hypothetical protein
MLNSFDWLRLAFTGAELLATLDCIVHEPDVLSGGSLGAPLSALDGPCERCRYHARLANDSLCAGCRAILTRRKRYTAVARHVVLVWGCVNRLPRALRKLELGGQTAVFSPNGSGVYIAGARRFLQVVVRRELQSWLHDLLLYDGGALTGSLQIFPTTGANRNLCMNDLVVRIVERETVSGQDQLRVRFYGAPYHVLNHYSLEQEGLLTFGAADFLGMLEMAVVFRQMLHPREQDMLRELLNIDDLNQEQFYWGRFLGMLSREARDMLHAWQVRQWSREQARLFYELLGYVYVDFPWLQDPSP